MSKTDLILCLDSIRRHLARTPYDPVAGTGCIGPRKEVAAPGSPSRQRVPTAMLADPAYKAARANATEWQKLRCRHDFEYWCATCARIKHKTRGAFEPFVLNAPQRRLAAVLEADRAAGSPLRVILLKARQWGGSHTIIYSYI